MADIVTFKVALDDRLIEAIAKAKKEIGKRIKKRNWKHSRYKYKK